MEERPISGEPLALRGERSLLLNAVAADMGPKPMQRLQARLYPLRRNRDATSALPRQQGGERGIP